MDIHDLLREYDSARATWFLGYLIGAGSWLPIGVLIGMMV